MYFCPTIFASSLCSVTSVALDVGTLAQTQHALNCSVKGGRIDTLAEQPAGDVVVGIDAATGERLNKTHLPYREVAAVCGEFCGYAGDYLLKSLCSGTAVPGVLG